LDDVTDDSRRIIVQGLAATAVTIAQMGGTEDDARAQLVGLLRQVGATDADVLIEAAHAMSTFPQPPNESPETIERREPVRQWLGVPSATEELEASLRAREWLQRLAADLREQAPE
jgi:acetyl-CoA carboxylase carboxyltransferase component